jgi:hypothetical protein
VPRVTIVAAAAAILLLAIVWRIQMGPAGVPPKDIRAPSPSSPPPPLASPSPSRTTSPSAQQPSLAPASPSSVRRLVTLSWGSRPDQAGRRNDPEAAGEGPMALAAGKGGQMLILDQTQGRVLRRNADGSFAAPIAIGADTVQDVRAAGDGVALLDRLGEKTLKRYDAAGKILDEKPLSALGVIEPGGTTALLTDSSGELYVEESLAGQGRRVVHALSGGAPLPGRPTRDGKTLLTGALLRQELAVSLRALDRDGNERWTIRLPLGRPPLAILLLDSDERGDVYLGVSHAAAPVPPSRDLTDERLELFRLDSSGAVRARTSLPHPPGLFESFRPLEVAGPGLIWWLHPLPDGKGVAVEEIRL